MKEIAVGKKMGVRKKGRGSEKVTLIYPPPRLSREKHRWSHLFLVRF